MSRGAGTLSRRGGAAIDPAPADRPDTGRATTGAEEPIIPIGEVRWRTHARIEGRIRSLRVQPWANVATLECVVVDDTGGLLLVFLGRRRVAGVELGRCIIAEGMVGNQRGYLAMLNPEIQLLV